MKFVLSCCFVCLPLKNIHLTSAFGYRIHPVTGRYALHNGIDLRARRDTVYAILDGLVCQTGYNVWLGYYIEIDHSDLFSSYGHLSEILVSRGSKVRIRQAIAITGASGRVTGEHLHFTIRYKDKYLDPLKFLYQSIKLNNHEQ